MRYKILLTLLLVLSASSRAVFSADFFVAPNGSDANPGTIDKPMRTIAQAQAAIRESGRLKLEPVTVFLRAGTYYLDEPLVLEAIDSGAQDAPVRYACYQDEHVVWSGGRRLTLDWTSAGNGILRAKTQGISFDQLFVNGVRQHMARYPNYDPESTAPYNGSAADAFSVERARRWANPSGGYIHALHRHLWGGYHYLITGKNSDGEITYEGGWQNNRQMGMHPEFRFVENIFEELDAPGEWFHDEQAGILYFMPPAGLDMHSAAVEVAQLRHLVEFQGSLTNPVQYITISGIVFRHAARTFMETREPLLRSDWTIYRGGAVLVNGAEDCGLEDCEFDQVGGNAVFVNNYNRRITVRGAHIHGIGGSGICFVGSPDAVRNPLFEYGQQQAYADIEMEPGPKSPDYPADCLVDECLIHGVSIIEKQAAGVQISMSSGITIRHCSIYDVGRAGINISEGTFGGHMIEFCDVFDTVRETGDHGSFNSWGRDRFWHLNNAPEEELPELAKLDAAKTVIRNSRWRCDHGWDVDLDDGSSNYDIYNNLFLRGGLKLREGFHRRVWNNIAINNGLHPHVWYANSMDEVTGNIWMSAYRPAGGMPDGRWGKIMDRNLFTSESDRTRFLQHGCDAHSIVGDPMFIDPAKGDYRVRPESPALEIGFENFPMDQFGVTTPRLQRIARTPEFPIPNIPKEIQKTGVSEKAIQTEGVWLGAEVKELSGGEYSAYGVSREHPGIAILSVNSGSIAERIGLRAGDVVQTLNGTPVDSLNSLLRVHNSGKSGAYKIGIVRDQEPRTITFEP